jgi:glycerol transport system permease protein
LVVPAKPWVGGRRQRHCAALTTAERVAARAQRALQHLTRVDCSSIANAVSGASFDAGHAIEDRKGVGRQGRPLHTSAGAHPAAALPRSILAEATDMQKLKPLVPTLYILFLMLPIYWLLSMSFKTTNEILGGFSLWPQNFTLDNYRKIFTDRTWYMGYVNSLTYVLLNTVVSVLVALPAAYAFSRHRFLGDKHLFFWLLSNRMAPPAVFALPFFQLYSSLNLFDTHIAVALAHCLFNIPLAVWILEGFMSGVPRELDETAFVDGYPFWRFFVKIFLPTIAAGIGVAAFFCFMFSWVELLLAKTLTSVDAKPIAATMTRTASTSGYELGLLAAAGTLTIVPGAIVIYFVRNYIAKGFALGRV